MRLNFKKMENEKTNKEIIREFTECELINKTKFAESAGITLHHLNQVLLYDRKLTEELFVKIKCAIESHCCFANNVLSDLNKKIKHS